jgi:3-deoxy-D-manno-octulosonate 8-phosphate phosphatase (KDO 8-P phosphatase)
MSPVNKSELSPALLEAFKKIKLFIFDVDGTLTDGNLYFAENGGEIKAFGVTDGLAMKVAGRLGYKVAIVTGRESEMVERRTKELSLAACRQKVWNKKESCLDVMKELGSKPEETLFMGDDIIDIPGMRACAVGVAVLNSSPEVLAEADYITEKPGGKGAAREVITLVLESQGRSLMEAFEF